MVEVLDSKNLVERAVTLKELLTYLIHHQYQLLLETLVVAQTILDVVATATHLVLVDTAQQVVVLVLIAQLNTQVDMVVMAQVET